MPTTVTKTVKSAGGDYSSLSAFEAGQQGNIVTADEIRQAECYDFSDTTAVSFDGWTTDATRYIRVFTPTAERHDGTAGTGYRISTTAGSGNYVLHSYEENFRVEGIEVFRTVGNRVGRGLGCEPSGTADIRISHCIVHENSERGIHIFGSGGGTAKVSNCIVWNTDEPGIKNDVKTLYVHNCTVCDCATSAGASAIEESTGIVHCVNVICQNQGTALGSGSVQFHAGITQSYNVSGDASASGTGSRASKTVTFVNAAGDDFRLDSADAEAKDLGTDLSADANLAVTDDIVGTARPQGSAFDMGASEVAAAAGIVSGIFESGVFGGAVAR